MSKVYRSEAFIVPVLNREVKNDNNVIDDVKISKMKNEEISKIDSSSDNNLKNQVVSSAESVNNLPVIKNEEIKINEIHDEEMKFSQEVIYDVPFSYLKNKKLQPAEFYNHSAKEDDKKNNFNISNIYNVIDEPIYEVPYSSSSYKKPGYSKYRERFETAEYVTLKLLPKQTNNNNNKYLLPKPPMRTSSLMSIDERGETSEDCIDELCCHGNKNGCTTTTKRPEAVTEEIFEVNWMKRLEQLRAREAIIKDREVMLYDRERLLFKKEKELRILERLLKDKLKHAELYLKRKSQIIDTVNLNDVENKFTEFSKAPSYSSSKSGISTQLSSTESLESHQKSDEILNELINSEFAARTDFKSCGSSTTGVNFSENKHMKNPPNSRSTLVTVNTGSLKSQASRLENASSNSMSRNTLPISGYSSCRSKRRPKMTYDDLDSTLSADNGDSSLVVTSRKFDPEIFKKPYILTRSSSERHQKIISDKIPECSYENEKTLKRISDSIVNSYDKNTKFQDYGLIDLRQANEKNSNNIGDSNRNRRYSYLDLEDGKKSTGSFRVKKDKKLQKDRPISWNEESNEWLQKKRQAYNLQTAKKMSAENFSNKENYSSHLKLNSNQTIKKNCKEKKFSIFR